MTQSVCLFVCLLSLLSLSSVLCPFFSLPFFVWKLTLQPVFFWLTCGFSAKNGVLITDKFSTINRVEVLFQATIGYTLFWSREFL